jgi:hypothetical protein
MISNFNEIPGIFVILKIWEIFHSSFFEILLDMNFMSHSIFSFMRCSEDFQVR